MYFRLSHTLTVTSRNWYDSASLIWSICFSQAVNFMVPVESDMRISFFISCFGCGLTLSDVSTTFVTSDV